MKYSFIIPMYNSEKYIMNCLKSILSHKTNNYEIVIVDDGSTDKSSLIVQQMAVKYQQIKYFRQENCGISVARNNGINYSVGQYIIFVDSDDEIEKKLLELLEKYTFNNDIDIIKYKVTCIEDNYSDRFELPLFNNLNGLEALKIFCLANKIFATPWGYLFKRDIYIKNNLFFANGKFHEDFGLIPLIILNANNMSSVDFYGYKYFKRENSVVTKNDDKSEYIRANDFLFHCINLIHYIEESDLAFEYKKLYCNYFANRAFLKINHLKKSVKNCLHNEYISKIKMYI